MGLLFFIDDGFDDVVSLVVTECEFLVKFDVAGLKILGFKQLLLEFLNVLGLDLCGFVQLGLELLYLLVGSLERLTVLTGLVT
jgi:hypothetical protein